MLETLDLISSKDKVTTGKETTFQNIELMRLHQTLATLVASGTTQETTITTKISRTTSVNHGIMTVLRRIVGLVLAIERKEKLIARNLRIDISILQATARQIQD